MLKIWLDILQKTIADIAEGMDLPRTAIPGILNIQKDASVLLRFKVGDQYLTEDQIQKILVRTGSQILDPVKVQKTLGASDEQDILARIGTDMGKASKRVKASTSARNFVEDQEGVNRLINHINETIKPKNKLQTLDDAFLIYDTSLESTLKAFGIQDQFANELVSALPAESPERAAMYRRRQGIRIATESYTQDVGQNFFRQELRRVGIADSANTEVDRVMSFIQNALTGDDGFISKSIKSGNVNEINIGSIVEHLESVSESQGITSGQMRGIRATFMDSLKKTQDGSMFINEIVSKNHAEQLQDNIIAARTNLDLLLSEASLSPEQSVLKKNLQQNIATFEQSFNQIASGDPVLQQSDRSLR